MCPPTSDLSSAIHHDIYILLQELFEIKLVQVRIDGVWATCRIQRHELTPRPDCFTNIDESIKIISRDDLRAFSFLDCFKDGKELEQVRELTATFLALKLSSELIQSWPKHLVSKKTISHWTIPVLFLRTRFYNYSVNTKHDKEILALILAKDLPVNQLVWSPYSTMSWSLATH